MRVVIVGAGIVGASVAWHLMRGGADVTVVEAGLPAQGASGRSFGWINASFHADADHFRLRLAGMAAWRRLAAEAGLRCVGWPGCLWWEEQGDGFDAMRDGLGALGYPVEEVPAGAVRRLEPGLAQVPERALRFATEGAVNMVTAVPALLSGARVVAGVAVRGIGIGGGRVAGVDTDQGRIAADCVVVAAGTGAPEVLAGVGVDLPMLTRPGVVMRTAPVGRLCSHILVAPGQEVRQDAAGRIVAPTSPGHQGSAESAVTVRPDALAEAALARVSALFGRDDLAWEQVALAARPVPGDGLPVVGAAGPEGLYVAVMHSGATLAAVVGELAAREILGGGAADMLAPYRAQRFAAG